MLKGTIKTLHDVPQKERRTMVQDVGHLCADLAIQKHERFLASSINGLSRNGARELLVRIGVTLAELYPPKS